MADHGASLKIVGLTKRYGSTAALDEVHLEVASGEFMTLLGPSGSGKTTTLNVVAGFVSADAGQVLLDGRPLDGVPPHRRDLGVVFQNYALFPHMRVAANVAFPLRQRNVGKADVVRRVGEALDIVGLAGMGERYPRELSGGQQQRVALARALVFQPKLLLLDEPLGALDKRLRESLQIEIKRIHRDVGATFVFVTHDQEEALAMSDRIAVFNQGGIEQVGTGEELYERPQSLFVAEFLGDSNIIRGRLRDEEGQTILIDGERRFRVDGGPIGEGPCALVVRPERMSATRLDSATALRANMLEGAVSEVIYLGSRRRLVADVGDRRFLVDDSATGPDWRLGDRIHLSWEPDAAHVIATREASP